MTLDLSFTTGDPAVTTPCSQCRGSGFSPWLGDEIPHAYNRTGAAKYSNFKKWKFRGNSMCQGLEMWHWMAQNRWETLQHRDLKLGFLDLNPSSTWWSVASSLPSLCCSFSSRQWCFWTVVLEKTLESPLSNKEIKPVNPKGNRSWMFIGRTDVEAPVLSPPASKSRLIGKDPDAGKDWGQEKKRVTGWDGWMAS